MLSLLKGNKSLLVIAVIAIVNALGYGIVIPIFYTYSHKFGLTDFQNGLLFALFSLCSFISSPVIGMLSDKYGRKPLLLISLVGTVISFLMMAFARNGWMLFLARALDGFTAGNIPVAQAVISDSMEPAERAKGFGIIGAAFGFGFVFGPAISGLTVGFGMSVPFLIAAAITMVAVIMTIILLKETNKHKGEMAKRKIFDAHKLVKSLFDDRVGKTLFITLLYSFAFGLFIFAYQPVSVKILHMDARMISVNFTIFGAMGLVAQMVIIPAVIKRTGDIRSLFGSLVISAMAFVGLFLAGASQLIFILVSMVLSLSNSFTMPVVNSLLSREVDHKSQGEILGINSSYMSLGSIFGPIFGGALASVGLSLPFLVGGIMVVGCVALAFSISKRGHVVSLH